MKLCVDTNRIIAALVKDGTARKILFDKTYSFITADYTLSEIDKHRAELQEKTKLTDDEFDIILTLLFENIEITPQSNYKKYINECTEMIDQDDVPLLAAALSCKADGIWTHDAHFDKQKKIKVFSNIDLLN